MFRSCLETAAAVMVGPGVSSSSLLAGQGGQRKVPVHTPVKMYHLSFLVLDWAQYFFTCCANADSHHKAQWAASRTSAACHARCAAPQLCSASVGPDASPPNTSPHQPSNQPAATIQLLLAPFVTSCQCCMCRVCADLTCAGVPLPV